MGTWEDPSALSDLIRERALDRARPDRYKRLTPEQITERMLSKLEPTRADREANRERMDQHYARQDAEQARRNRLEAMRGIRLDFPTYADAEPTAPAVAEWVTAAVSGDRRWLVLLGPVGTGKTWQAVGAYRAAVETTGWDGVVLRATTLLMRASGADSERVPWAAYEDADLLLLDDIPPSLTEHDRRTLLRLIDTRQARQRRTIITTNLGREQVRAHLGDQLASRLSAGTRVVVMEGADRRLAR